MPHILAAAHHALPMPGRFLLPLAAALSVAGSAAAGDAATWAALRAGGHVALVRHASTEPGLGDPPGYDLGDCTTQRRLSETGRGEARRLGERFRSEGVAVAQVYSSPWCRCLDTARLAFGRSEAWAALGSFFDRRDREAGQTAEVRRWLAGRSAAGAPGVLVLVTHHVNIAALTGHAVGPGEVIVVRPSPEGALAVVGRLRVP